MIDKLANFLQTEVNESFDEGVKECGFWCLNHLQLNDTDVDKLKEYLYNQGLYDYRD